jgi:hypothetical protein
MRNSEAYFMLSSITAARLRARISITQNKYWCVGRQEERKKEKRKKKKGRRKEDKKRQSRKSGSLDWVSLKQGLPDANSAGLLRSASLLHIREVA